MAVACKRGSCEFLSSMSERVFENGLEKEVVDVSGDESEHWCDECVCA